MRSARTVTTFPLTATSNRYKEIQYEEIEYDPPKTILKKLNNLETEQDTISPEGKLIDAIEGKGAYAADYFTFLQALDPLELWEDVKELDKPLPIDYTFELDQCTVNNLVRSTPDLSKKIFLLELQNTIAPILGIRYAWSRLFQHSHLLRVIENLFDKSRPPMVMEVGCFTGGLLHFLAQYWPDCILVGIDISQTALKVCAHYDEEIGLENHLALIETDFARLQVEDLPEYLPDAVVDGSVIILSNVLTSIGEQWSVYPAIENWHGEAGMISYWVNQGVTVLVCERHDDPPLLCETLVDAGRWEKQGCNAKVLVEFDTLTTDNQLVDNPFGDWKEQRACVFGFFPSSQAKG